MSGEQIFFQVGYQSNEDMVTIISGEFSHSGPFGHIDLDRIAKTIARYKLPTGVLVIMDPMSAQRMS
jgi:hypothetical protein